MKRWKHSGGNVINAGQVNLVISNPSQFNELITLLASHFLFNTYGLENKVKNINIINLSIQE